MSGDGDDIERAVIELTDDPESGEGYEGPSKSARKRAAHEAQRLGLRLIELPEAELAALGLPERLLDALEDARRIRSRAAAVRQRQYIGRIMRDLDPLEIIAALEERDRRRALATRRQKRITEWRARLIEDGAAALDAFSAQHPRADRRRLADLVSGASGTQGPESARITAARELYRALRELVE